MTTAIRPRNRWQKRLGLFALCFYGFAMCAAVVWMSVRDMSRGGSPTSAPHHASIGEWLIALLVFPMVALTLLYFAFMAVMCLVWAFRGLTEKSSEE